MFLEGLKLEVIDLYQIHVPDTNIGTPQPRFSQNLTTRDRLVPVLSDTVALRGLSLFARTLPQPGVTAALFGARSPGGT